jgi:DNA-binding response OmpR family regulator
LTQRILIVEDDVLLAMDLAEQLEASGFQVVGPCLSAAQALDTFEKEGCDVAVLDINLGHGTSEPVAKRLRSMSIPFVVASGYSRDQWPNVFRGQASVTKPFHADALVELIAEVAQPN